MDDLFGLLGVPLTAPLASTAFSSLEAHVGAIWGTCGWGGSARPPMTPSFAQEPKGQGGWSPAPADVLLGPGLQAPSLQETHWHPPLGFSRPLSLPLSPSLLATPKNPTTPRSEKDGGSGSQGTFSKKCVSECAECECLVSQASAWGVCMHLCAPVSCLSLSLCHFLCCASAVSVCVSAGPVVLGPLFGETEPLPIQNFGLSWSMWPASCWQVSGK